MIQNKAQNIAIIGAGPAGIFTALEILKKVGSADHTITIFGDPANAQPQTYSNSTGTVVFDVGTCYTHIGYNNSIIPLAQKYGFNLDPESKENRTVKSDKEPSRFQSVTNSIAGIALLTYLKLCRTEWKLLHNKFPSLYAHSFKDHLDKRGLSVLSNNLLFNYAVTVQGYGPIDDVSTSHMFEWCDSGLLTALLYRNVTEITGLFEDICAHTIRQGYGTLFNTVYNDIIKDPRIQVIPAGIVNKVIKIGGNQLVDVEFIENSEHLVKQYDQVICACDFTKIDTPFSNMLDRGRDIDITYFGSLVFTSTVKLIDPSKATAPVILNKLKNVPLHIVSRNNEELADGVYWYWSVIYCTDNQNYDAIQQQIMNFIREKILNNDQQIELSVKYFKILEYNVRFSLGAESTGARKTLKQMQGIDGIWYNGGLASHWDVDSIFEFTEDLVSKMSIAY